MRWMTRSFSVVPVLPKWKQKVGSKVMKRQMENTFRLKEHFPCSEPIHNLTANRNWGVDAELESQPTEWVFGDEKEVKNEVRDETRSFSLVLRAFKTNPTTNNELDHFLCYRYVKEYIDCVDSSRLIGRKQLRDLMFMIASSNVLHPDTRLHRFNVILERYSTEGYKTDTLLLKASGAVNAHTLIDLATAKSYLYKTDGAIHVSVPYAISGLCMNGQVDSAIEILNSLALNLSQDERNVSVNYIMEGIVKHKHPLDAYHFYMSQIKFAKYVPSPWTSHLLLKSFVPSHDSNVLERSINVVESLAENGAVITFGMFITLLVIARKNKMVEFETLLVEQIRERGLNIEHILYRVELDTFLNVGDIEGAEQTFKKYSKTEGCTLDHIGLNRLASACAENAMNIPLSDENNKQRGFMMTKANLYYTTLRDSRLHMENGTLTKILQLFASSSNHLRCRTIVRDMHTKSIPLSAEHFYHYIDAYCRCGSVLLAGTAVKEMIEWKIQPSSAIYNRIIRAYLEQTTPNYDKALDTLRQMPELKLNITEDTHMLFTSSFSGPNPPLSHITTWFNLLVGIGVAPSAHVYNMMMRAYYKLGNHEKVEFYYRLLLNSAVTPNAESVYLHFQSCFIMEDWKNCLQIWTNDHLIRDNYEAYLKIMVCHENMKQPIRMDNTWEDLITSGKLSTLKKIDSQYVVQKQSIESRISNYYLSRLLLQGRVPESLELIVSTLLPLGIPPHLSLVKHLFGLLKKDSRSTNTLQQALNNEMPFLAKLVKFGVVPAAEQNSRKLHQNLNEFIAREKAYTRLIRKETREQ